MASIFSRRSRQDLSTPAETAINNAIEQVEKMAAEEKLTKAVDYLLKAKYLVADYVDDKIANSFKIHE